MAEAKKKATVKNEETVKVNPLKAGFTKIGNWFKVNKRVIIGTAAGTAGGGILGWLIGKHLGTKDSGTIEYIELEEDTSSDSDVTSYDDSAPAEE